jgi:hypothetical protein
MLCTQFARVAYFWWRELANLSERPRRLQGYTT